MSALLSLVAASQHFRAAAPPPATGSVTINGSGFGAKATAAPLYFSTFDNYPDGTSWADTGLTTGFSANTVVSSARSHSGARSLLQPYAGNTFEKMGMLVDGGLSLYMAEWFYWERTGTPTFAHVFKLNRAGCNAGYSGVPAAYLTIRPEFAAGDDSIIADDNGYRDGVTEIHDQSRPKTPFGNAWHFLEFKYRLSTPGVADGWYQWYCDGALCGNQRPVATRAAGFTDELAWAFTAFTGMDIETDPVTYQVYQDEIIIDTTHARVIATDAADYAASTKWAPQKPSTWSDTEITLDEPNWGNLAGGSTAYFHVFDAEDNHVSAHAVTVP